MRIIQINEKDFVTYHIDDTSVVASAYISEKLLGEMIFNMKSEVKEEELDVFTVKGAMALHEDMKEAYIEEYGR